MRLRNKNWVNTYIEENKKHLITNHKKLHPKSFFKKNKKYFLEIGCGKGEFIINNALKYPYYNYVAIEKEATVIGVALKKAISLLGEDFLNIKFLNSYAEKLLDIFASKSFDGIYLNFSDPWSKSRHYKKRLTYIMFLNIYYDLLKKGGVVEIKTDNDNLYKFSLEQIHKSKFIIVFNSEDIYDDKENIENNIASEYEKKFYSLNQKIKKIIIKK